MAAPTRPISHWHRLLEGVQASPLEFYSALEQAIEMRQIPDAFRARVERRESGLLSARRQYLRVRRKAHFVDISGVPFGTGFFVSWWLTEIPSEMAELVADSPALTSMVQWASGRSSYFNIDTGLAFQSAIHNAVLEVIDAMTSTQGLRALSELERKPIMRELFEP